MMVEWRAQVSEEMPLPRQSEKNEPDFHCEGRETIAEEVGLLEVLYVSE
jgi:hypothetical protein